MSLPFQLLSRTWLIIVFCAVGFVVWTGYERAQRVEYVTNTDREEAVVDAASPTGYAGGKRWLIVPEHNNRSYQWIAETQQMLAKGEWRVRHIDYENAPFGREVHSASPYRWWLGLMAWCDHAISGRPIALSVERAALFADPVLHLLLLIGTTIFVARRFGSFPAGLLALGLVTIYPFAGGFLPGMPDDLGLARICALWSILPLLAWAGSASANAKQSNARTPAIESARANQRQRSLFFLAGVAGGFGLWVNAANQTPVLLGIVLGGILAAWLAVSGTKPGSGNTPGVAPWRTWALGGAVTCLIGYLIEYFPAHMELRLQVNHPLYGVAWLAVGELLERFAARMQQGKPSTEKRGRAMAMLVAAILAIAALPATLVLKGNQLLLAGDLLSSRLVNLPDGAVAKSLLDWIARDGITGAVAAALFPVLLLGPAIWLLVRHQTGKGSRVALALALGPVALTLIFACLQLRWWNMADVALLALVVAASTVTFHRSRWVWVGLAGLAFLPGLIQLVPSVRTGGNGDFTRLEVEALIERSLAHWIADRASSDGAVILAPPDRTTSWCFHGGFRGLGTANWENRDGLAATVRIITATTAEEALGLIHQRGVTHLILPSWDADLDAFARWTLHNPEDAFIMALHHWALPPWLRPIPYTLPTVAGFEDQSVVILAVTDDSNRVASLGRLAEYFIETKQPELAASTGEALRRYPADLGALVALAEVQKVRGDTEGFDKTFKALLSSLASGFDRMLAWDRRVSLTVVLAQGNREDLSKQQLRLCLEKADEARIRSLTTMSLFRLMTLSKAFELNFPDSKLREIALKLLPEELRSRL